MATKTLELTYTPRRQFQPYHARHQRWSVVVAHRRAGKTVAAVNDLGTRAVYTPKENGRYAYIAPFYSQAKQIAWDYVKYYFRGVATKISEGNLTIDLFNDARITLYGADNPDSFRGLYFDGAVIDEYGNCRPNLWTEILRPALSDRRGWCTFIGTFNGINHFYNIWQHALLHPDEWFTLMLKASETGIIPADELADLKAMMSEQEYAQEMECEPMAVTGGYYTREMAKAREEGRITDTVPTEPGVAVNTYWDLGRNDTTALWFEQRVGFEHRFIDYYENAGESLAHYAHILQQKNYVYGTHYLPHDASVTELSSLENLSREELLNDLGVRPTRIVAKTGDLLNGIELVRRKLHLCWFHSLRCAKGIAALENYRKEWDDRTQSFRSRPLHNWASNGADAFRQWAQGEEDIAYQPNTRRTRTGYERRQVAHYGDTTWIV